MTSTVADSLWGSTPIITCSTALLLRWLFVAIGTARWAVLLRAGQSLSHASSRCPTGCRPEVSHTRKPRVSSRIESVPPDTLDRVWPDSGPTGNPSLVAAKPRLGAMGEWDELSLAAAHEV